MEALGHANQCSHDCLKPKLIEACTADTVGVVAVWHITRPITSDEELIYLGRWLELVALVMGKNEIWYVNYSLLYY